MSELNEQRIAAAENCLSKEKVVFTDIAHQWKNIKFDECDALSIPILFSDWEYGTNGIPGTFVVYFEKDTAKVVDYSYFAHE